MSKHDVTKWDIEFEALSIDTSSIERWVDTWLTKLEFFTLHPDVYAPIQTPAGERPDAVGFMYDHWAGDVPWDQSKREEFDRLLALQADRCAEIEATWKSQFFGLPFFGTSSAGEDDGFPEWYGAGWVRHDDGSLHPA